MLRIALALLALLVGCERVGDLRLAPPGATANVTGLCTLGSPGCTAASNRVALQAAVTAANSGDTVVIPDGTYEVNVASSRTVLVNKPLTIRGTSRDGTILIYDDATAEAPGNTTARMFEVTGDDVTIENMTLDGNKPNPGVPTLYVADVEHHNGLFVGTTSGVVEDFTLQDNVLRNFQGDALQIYADAHRPRILRNVFQWNQRSGMSFTPPDGDYPVLNAQVIGNTFTGTTNQSIDNEHGPVYGAEIAYNVIDAGFNNYCMTMSGYALEEAEEVPGFANRSKDWHVHHNTFACGIFIIRADDGLWEHNTFRNPTTKSCFDVNRSSARQEIRHNDCQMLNASFGSFPVLLTGTHNETDGVDTWQAYPSEIHIHHNDLRALGHISSTGVRLINAESVVVEDNTIVGPGATAAGHAGIFARATAPVRGFGTVTARRNVIRGFGQYGVSVVTDASTSMVGAVIEGNLCENAASNGPMKTCVSLSGATGTLQTAIVRGNVSGCGVTSAITGIPAATPVTLSPLAMSAACN